MDAALTSWDAAANQIVLDNTYTYNTSLPNAYSGGTATWDDLRNWEGLANNATGQFPFVPSGGGPVNPAAALGAQRLVVTDFTIEPALPDDTSFRLSFDGGVSADTVPAQGIPEPSSALLLTAGLWLLGMRRRRR